MVQFDIDVDPTADVVPDEQDVGTDAPATQNEPAGHVIHVFCPVVDW